MNLHEEVGTAQITKIHMNTWRYWFFGQNSKQKVSYSQWVVMEYLYLRIRFMSSELYLKTVQHLQESHKAMFDYCLWTFNHTMFVNVSFSGL